VAPDVTAGEVLATFRAMAQIQVRYGEPVLFRHRNKLPFNPDDGMQVLARPPEPFVAFGCLKSSGLSTGGMSSRGSALAAVYEDPRR
jgi:hypothetical protein